MRADRLKEMKAKFGQRNYEKVLNGNDAADKLANNAHSLNEPTMPVTSVMDDEFVPYLLSGRTNDPNAKVEKRRISEDIRKEVYNGRRATEVDAHKANQRELRSKHTHTIARDAFCDELDDKTDLKQSAKVLDAWRKDPSQANTLNFLYRARRGALLEKAKAFSRIEEEKQKKSKPMFTRSYGTKYSWNARCPCCGIAEEKDLHAITRCQHTQDEFRKTLRQETIDILKEQADQSTHRTLERDLPAWFYCGDDTVQTNARSNELLKQINNYDKYLGSLAYIPAALIKWLRELKCYDDANKLHNALFTIQQLLATRAHQAWIKRCKVFEEQWREECKRRKEREQRERAAQEAQRREQKEREREEAAQRAQQQRGSRNTQRNTGSTQTQTHTSRSVRAEAGNDKTRSAPRKTNEKRKYFDFDSPSNGQ